MTDLWPDDFGPIDTNTPIVILRQQAAALEKKTQGMVRGEVEPYKPLNGFRFGFYLVAPALDNYTYRLFDVEHPVEMYPVKIRIEEGSEWTEHVCYNEVALLEKLQTVFNSDRTKKVIRSILAQVQSLTA